MIFVMLIISDIYDAAATKASNVKIDVHKNPHLQALFSELTVQINDKRKWFYVLKIIIINKYVDLETFDFSVSFPKYIYHMIRTT